MADGEDAPAGDEEPPTSHGERSDDDGAPDLAARRGIETTVYQPAEDSGLLADAALELVGAGDLVLEVGTGSGYVAARVAAETGARVVASDVNPHACRAARERLGEATGGAGEAPVSADVVRADLVGPFREGAFDAVLFNPPYLPTDPETGWDDWMERALSGGETGLATVERFLPAVPRVLAPDGRVLLLASTLAGVDGMAELAGEAGFSAAAVEEASFPFETLTVLKLVR